MLRRRGLSSDTIASLIIGATTTLWSGSVIRYTYHASQITLQLGWKLDERHTYVVIAQLAKAPLLLQVLFIFWLVSWTDGLRAEKSQHAKPHLWSLANLRGPFDWQSGMRHGFRLTLLGFVCLSVAIPAVAAILVGDPFDGILTIAGLLVFLFDGVPNNPYVRAEHRYADDRLRIALPTSHHEGTIYVLPSKGVGIDAVWSPKVVNEYIQADHEIMTLFQHIRSGRWAVSEPLERLRKTLAMYQERVVISVPQLERLAAWIYCDKTTGEETLREFECARATDTHLIGRDLMYALCHAEYLVFMGQGRLPAAITQKLGTLRLLSRSGAGRDGDDVPTVGFAGGFEGYRAAVEHVYAIFNLEVDPLAVMFDGTDPPRYSAALSRTPSDINDYVTSLWDTSCEHTESTFSALYFFCTVWFMEIGSANGFHIFPLRCRTREGDLVSQQIAWRQAWYAGVISQLVSAFPSLFGLYVLGYLR